MRRRTDFHIDVTYRKAEDMARLEEELEKKEKEIQRLKGDVFRFSGYAAINVRYYDQLKRAKLLLMEAGLDADFIEVQASPPRKKRRK